ncbi:MAG: hypothetical protein NC393_10780 [Clostridium sp.]|nr:hypothetical protein [Clostridium sp.]MCM1172591.1 hypothetical protein [Clostridium sp.]MCM1209090.1 hypothetical protein [Ruminococcus sp.]
MNNNDKKNFIKGSKILFALSIVLIISSLIQAILGFYVITNIISIILWLAVLICSIKGW